jgi:hypothetical protein
LVVWAGIRIGGGIALASATWAAEGFRRESAAIAARLREMALECRGRCRGVTALGRKEQLDLAAGEGAGESARGRKEQLDPSAAEGAGEAARGRKEQLDLGACAGVGIKEGPFDDIGEVVGRRDLHDRAADGAGDLLGIYILAGDSAGRKERLDLAAAEGAGESALGRKEQLDLAAGETARGRKERLDVAAAEGAGESAGRKELHD